MFQPNSPTHIRKHDEMKILDKSLSVVLIQYYKIKTISCCISGLFQTESVISFSVD